MAPISFLNIYNFAKIMEIDDFDEFLYYMRLLDDVYLKHIDRTTDGPNRKASQANTNKGQGSRQQRV